MFQSVNTCCFICDSDMFQCVSSPCFIKIFKCFSCCFLCFTIYNLMFHLLVNALPRTPVPRCLPALHVLLALLLAYSLSLSLLLHVPNFFPQIVNIFLQNYISDLNFNYTIRFLHKYLIMLKYF